MRNTKDYDELVGLRRQRDRALLDLSAERRNLRETMASCEQLRTENKTLRETCHRTGEESLKALRELIEKKDELAQLRRQRDEARARCEQIEVQLAGCGVAALGGTDEPAKQGDYGWSPAYQETLELRLKYEAAMKALAEERARLDAIITEERQS